MIPRASGGGAKALARLMFLAGAVGVGLLLFRAMPREVTLVYGLADTGAEALDVDVERDGELVRHAEFRFPSGAPPTVSHRVRLTDGAYVIHATIVRGGRPRRVDRAVTVTESGPLVIPLGP